MYVRIHKISGYPESQPGGLLGAVQFSLLSQGTQPLAQLTHYSSQPPVVHHAPYIHGNRAPPPPTSHHPWQPAVQVHQATNNSGLQVPTLATPSSSLIQQGQFKRLYRTTFMLINHKTRSDEIRILEFFHAVS